MKIVLVANYVPDGQHSMLGFAAMMQEGLKKAGHEVQTVYPPVVFGKIGYRAPKLQKWLAYVDKILLFPPVVRKAAQSADIVHVCDHSNAIYIPKVRRVPYIATCHDLLAVRGGIGEQTDCPASPIGKWLQRWILSRLKRADGLACASKTTLADVRRLLPGDRPTDVLPLALRYNLRPVPESQSKQRLKAIRGLNPHKAFILHVGSSHRRKNREGVLRIFSRVAGVAAAQLVFVGKPLTTAQRQLAVQLGIAGQVIEAGEVSNELLAVLYGSALAFLFPSRFEGFGWPIVEAQSCGCPVICSDKGPFPEVAGDGALMRDVDDEAGFAEAIVALATSPGLRSVLIEKGFQNLQRYRPEIMISRYLALYERVLGLRQRQKHAVAHVAA